MLIGVLLAMLLVVFLTFKRRPLRIPYEWWRLSHGLQVMANYTLANPMPDPSLLDGSGIPPRRMREGNAQSTHRPPSRSGRSFAFPMPRRDPRNT